MLAWVEAGGVYAIANLRGGGEEGEAWHRAGMREHKQNVFDDFHAAAERLVADGWTTPDQLAISGGSNGGLLVGAALTQRPELYARRRLLGAAARHGALRAVRARRDAGTTSTAAPTTPRSSAGCSATRRTTTCDEGVDYPATLFTVFDGDTRVDPLHARKMCAALQHATVGDTPDRAAPGEETSVTAPARCRARSR